MWGMEIEFRDKIKMKKKGGERVKKMRDKGVESKDQNILWRFTIGRPILNLGFTYLLTHHQIRGPNKQ